MKMFPHLSVIIHRPNYGMSCYQFDVTLSLWCYRQRRKQLFGNPSLSDEKVHLLNAIGFDWENTSSPSRNLRSTTMAIRKRNTRSAQVRYPGRSTVLSSNATHPSKKEKSQPKKKKVLMKVKEEMEPEDYATNIFQSEAENREKEDSLTLTAPTLPKPNMDFLRRSISGATWVAHGVSELVKVFVSF
jgi:hypothetical protein